MTLTVEFEIHPEGICDDCGGEYAGICRPFKRVVKKSYPRRKEPCAECDAYLERESRKRHCRVCGNQDCNKPCDGADSKGAYVINCSEFTAPPRPEVT